MANKTFKSLTPQGLDTTYKVPAIAPEYSATNTYAVGDLAVYQGVLYKCTTAIDTPEAWTVQHWQDTTIGDEVSDLKESLSDVYIPSENLHNPATDRHGINIDGNGVISEDPNYMATDYIHVGAGGKVTIQVVEGYTSRIFYYTTNDPSGFSRALWITSVEPKTIKLLPTEAYIVITLYENAPDFMVNLGASLLPYAPYGGAAGTFLEGIVDDIHTEISAINNDLPQKNIINRFNPATITEGRYINTSNGILAASDGFYASDFIYIGDLEKVTVSYTHIFGWYDENKVWIGHPETMNSGNSDLTFEVPENAQYLRFSAYNNNLSRAQIGENISRSNYMEYGYFTIPYLVTDDNEIIVDVNGSGDYTSLTEALFENVDSKTTIRVKKGTYDLHAEYIAKWGESAVDAMSDADSSIFNGFQFGAIIRNRKVIFESGCFLVCNYTYQSDGVTPQIVDGIHRICALRLDYNAEVYGLNLVATHTFYAIHDDYGTNEYYQNVYENCYVKGVNLTNVNCIGGGVKGKSRHVIKNCYFDNGEVGTTVRYHNTNSEGSTPEIYISNCFFSYRFSANYYGPQTSKMRVYVNNCKAKFIVKDRESSSFDVDNVELYKWCNEETG